MSLVDGLDALHVRPVPVHCLVGRWWCKWYAEVVVHGWVLGWVYPGGAELYLGQACLT